jgi:hypothetical protein
MGALFLVGLLAASIAVSIHNFQVQTAFAVSATDNAAIHDGNNITNTTQPASTHLMNSGTVPTDAETKLVLALRDLWVDHTDWTRMYIVSFLADLPDTDVVAQRLLTLEKGQLTNFSRTTLIDKVTCGRVVASPLIL